MFRRAFVLAAAGAVLAPLAWGQAEAALSDRTPRQIDPENQLERDFLAAYASEAMRGPFRLSLLQSQVALALQNSAADSPPREFGAEGGVRAGLIYTSSARLSSVLGPAAPRALMTGRDALERLRGKHVALNFGLLPVLTLEPGDVESYLAAASG